MDVNEYQSKTLLTEIYGTSIHEFTKNANIAGLWQALRIQYVALGLAGEAGEIANKVKKQIRDNHADPFDVEFQRDMINEIGDLMWYISQFCNETGLDLDGIMEQNIIKLRGRKISGTLQGSGDER